MNECIAQSNITVLPELKFKAPSHSYKAGLSTCRNFIRPRQKPVPCRPAIGWRKVNKPCVTNSRPANMFLPWTNKVSTC